ncbi:MAG: neutral/alkaline non-lysosomal ceramidase N-terminal domain-containing protein [Candidatus Hydrogenedentota bacterium]
MGYTGRTSSEQPIPNGRNQGEVNDVWQKQYRAMSRAFSLPLFMAVVLTVALAGAAWGQAPESEGKVFQAGAAASNVTPPLGVSLGGSMRDRTATHIRDELHARCLVLDDGDTRIALVLVDNCVIPRHIFDSAKELVQEETGIPADHVLMAATHSHTTPTTTGIFQSEPNKDYIPFLIRRIADGVRRAVNNLEPARIAWGSGNLPDEVFNRRWHLKPGTMPENPFGTRDDKVKMNPPRGSEALVRPAGPIDPEIMFIAVESKDGRPIALLANYSLHYVGGIPGNHVSADYFGVFADRIQELLDADRLEPPFVGIMSNGTSGDINNINFREPRESKAPGEQMTHVAHAAAEVVHKAYANLEWQDGVHLDAAAKELQLGVRLPTEEEVARGREIMAAAEGPEMKSLAEIYARETVLLSEYPEKVKLLVQALRIGDLSIAAIPCEVFAETGLEIKEKSPFAKTFTIELANGYNGYLPTPEQHALGGYETWRARSSCLEVPASCASTTAVFELFDQLHPGESE